jgi:hypothetical protein
VTEQSTPSRSTKPKRKSRVKRKAKGSPKSQQPKSTPSRAAEETAAEIDRQVVSGGPLVDTRLDEPEPEQRDTIEGHDGQKLVRVERETDGAADETEPPSGETIEADAETDEPIPETRPSASSKTLEQIAEKYARDGAQQEGAVDDEEPDDLPSIDEVAAATVFDNHPNPVPPVETDPNKREQPTMGPVNFTPAVDVPDLADPKAKPRSLEDLMAVFPVGDGQYTIRVNRRGPKSWGGYQCAGVQRPIRRSMDMGQFIREYGGGEYGLTVYGPPARGGVADPETGRIRPKALTGEVTFTVPYTPPFGGPPNPEASVDFDEDAEQEAEEWMQEEPMRYGPAFRPVQSRPTTPADAKIHEAELQAQEREREREEQRRRESEQRMATLPSQIAPLLDTVQQSNTRMVELMAERNREDAARAREEYEEERARRMRLEEEQRRRDREEREAERQRREEEQAKLEREREELKNKPSAAEDLARATSGMMAPVLQALTARNNDGSKGEADALRVQIAQMNDANKAELARIHEAHQNEMRREREAHEAALKREQDRAQDISDRAERRANEAEERAERRIREVQERTERDVKAAKEDGDKRVAEAERIWKDRLEDERRNHERELRSIQSNSDTRLATEKSIADNARTMLQGEVERERAEKARYQQEALEKGDVVAQVQKVTAVAESLGFTKADGAVEGGDWKSQLLGIGVNLAQNLPEVIANAGNAVAQAKAPHVQVVQQPGPMYPPALPPGSQSHAPPLAAAPPMYPGGFATEDGVDYDGLPDTRDAVYPGPAGTRPGMVPPPPPEAVAGPPTVPPPMPPQPVSAQVPPQPVAPMPPQAPPQPAPQPAHSGPQLPAPAVPRPPATAPTPPAAPAATAGAPEIPDAQILALRPVFEEALQQQVPPEQFAAELVEEHGVELVGQIAAVLSPQRITAALVKSPDGARSPLVRRAGQQYLKALFDAVNKAVTQ